MPMSSLTRRQMLRGSLALAAGGVLGAPGCAAIPRRSHGDTKQRPNIVLLWIDQQRHPQHWPEGFAEAHLPADQRLMRHGLSFRRAYTAAAQCAPSRATFLTGTYPTTHGVTNTMPSPLLPLQSFQHNLVRMMADAGYRVAYKGKWHLSVPVRVGAPAVYAVDEPPWSRADIAHLAEAYGVPGWNPPDAGTTEFSLSTLGGGKADNDGRILSGATAGTTGQTPGWGECALEFLERYASSDRGRPFCLFVSLVNPHDISVFPRLYAEAGYRLEEFRGLGIPLPGNAHDSLETKPRIQRLFRDYFDTPEQGGALPSPQDRLDYVNFYAYLQKLVDEHVGALLDGLESLDLVEDTIVVRFSDHGEQGLSHGLRQKMFSAYEETIHVPLVVSNPQLFPEPVQTDAFASLLDLLPTIAALGKVPEAAIARTGCKGVDLGPVLRDPEATVQDSVLFSYDDWFGPGFQSQALSVPAHIRAVREGPWTYCVYFTANGDAFEYELYNLDDDPLQLQNLAHRVPSPDANAEEERRRLHAMLTRKMSRADALPGGFAWRDDRS